MNIFDCSGLDVERIQDYVETIIAVAGTAKFYDQTQFGHKDENAPSLRSSAIWIYQA
jgi:hypothetical protein